MKPLTITLTAEEVKSVQDAALAYEAYACTDIQDAGFAACEERWADSKRELAFLLIGQVRQAAGGDL